MGSDGKKEGVGVKQEGLQFLTRDLVLSYMVHSRYVQSSQDFARSCGLPLEEVQFASIEKRKNISDLICDGKPLEALSFLDSEFPKTLETNPEITFWLKCQHFVECLRKNDVTEALFYAQTQLKHFSSDEALLPQLQDYVSLLAYQDVEACPSAPLMNVSKRQELANKINSIILVTISKSAFSCSHLERLVRHYTASLAAESRPKADSAEKGWSLHKFLEKDAACLAGPKNGDQKEKLQ
mmetsp:Transcript_32304/g.80987  ORF Transcript_32304/g.80987 Transcript_32304/m.80987 type:complete len:239 (+) Transcript_32304:200-916(+)